jgi:DNA helicase II / ATP-dependent DNA helicase PcrA
VHKILEAIRDSDSPITALSAYRPGTAWKSQFEQLTGTLKQLLEPTLTPSDMFDLVMQYYEPVFERMYYDDYPKRRKELDQIKILITGYGDLQSFVDDTALDPPDTGSGESHAEDEQRLILSTIHSAKGLEWDTVFVIGLAEGRFPHQNASPGEQWEEERRLLYVAATRAKKKLVLTYPRELMTPDRQQMRTSMSPFLREISPGLYNTIDRGGAISAPLTSRYSQDAAVAPSTPKSGVGPNSVQGRDANPSLHLRSRPDHLHPRTTAGRGSFRPSRQQDSPPRLRQTGDRRVNSSALPFPFRPHQPLWP